MQQFNVIVERDEDGFYVGSITALRGCHTQAKSLDVLMDRMKEAAMLCLENQQESIPMMDFVGVQRIAVPA